jgi:hypothetical protein
MTKPRTLTFDELLPRMQFAFFEFMWPGYRWIESLWIKESDGQYQLFAETMAPQHEEEVEEFNHIAGRILKGCERLLDELAPGSKHKLDYTIQYGPSVPRDHGYRELMTARVFRMIAKRQAPWRLEDGQ